MKNENGDEDENGEKMRMARSLRKPLRLPKTLY
jgi:hypothetical protein